jgi:branched-chain amino acid transport system substrate-binding protein
VEATSLRASPIVAALVALTVGLASACGGAPTDATNGAGEQPEPILIGGSGPNSGQAFNAPEQLEGLEIAIAAINAAGGVNGRPLQLEYCDGKFDPNAEISCARQMAKNKIVAAVDPFFTADSSGTAYKILDDAGIPQISRGSSTSQLTSPQSYLLSSGLPGWYYGVASSLISSGARKVSILVSPVGTAQFAAKIMTEALEKARIQYSIVEFDPKADPTGATAAAKAMADGVQGVGLSMTTGALPIVVTAMRRAGYTGSIASCSCSFTPAVIQALGPDAEGIDVVSQTAFSTDTTNPGVREYLADLKAYGNGAAPKEIGMFAWSSIKLFAELASRLDTVDAVSVGAAFESARDPIDVGTAAPWATADKRPPLPEYPRVINTSVQIGVVRNGSITADGKGFVDPFERIDKASEPGS